MKQTNHCKVSAFFFVENMFCSFQLATSDFRTEIGERNDKITHITKLGSFALIRKHSSNNPSPVLKVLIDGCLHKETQE